MGMFITFHYNNISYYSAIQAVDSRAALGVGVAVWAPHVQMNPGLAAPRHRVASPVASPPPSATPQSHALPTHACLKAEITTIKAYKRILAPQRLAF